MFHQFLALFDKPYVHLLLHDAALSAPVWVPLLLAALWIDIYMTYKQRQWIQAQGSVLLEIRLPREMLKSPVAMELFLNHLNQTGVGSYIDVYLKGRVRNWFSLELVSIDGVVHFYIWMQKNYRNRVEAQLYAQFPNIEVHEAADYTLGIHRDPARLSIGWAGQFALTKADAYPIKTYVDYGLDKDPKEEFKNDPLIAVLEYLGNLKKGEQAWIQILIQGHIKEGLKYLRVYTKPDWRSSIEKEIKEILKKGVFKPEDDKTIDSTKHLSQGQKDVIQAIERTSSKPAFDVMIRGLYFAEKEAFNATNIGGIIGTMTQYNSPSLNGFFPKFHTGSLEYPWQDPFKKKRVEIETGILESYKRRSFFNPPFKNFNGKAFILTTEELATIFHFPGTVAATPTLPRIPSRKSEAPSNLPI